MKIINGKIYNTEKKDFFPDTVSFGEKIGEEPDGGIIDAVGCLVVPGYIDNHTHGRDGVDVMEDITRDEFKKMYSGYAAGGVTTVFPTVMTNPVENILASILRIAQSASYSPITTAGIHIEGPYISKSAPGCHRLDYIRSLDDIGTVSSLIDAAGELRVHLTVAPEQDGAEALIRYCVGRGATVGIGHSTASYEECKHALELGCTSFTHTFNAMKPLAHREPGTVGASLITDAYSEFICDGFHVNPDVISLAYRAKGEDRFVTVTDSLPPAGMPDGRYSLAGMPVNVSGKTILTDGGTIAGSGIDMHTSVLNLMSFCGISYGKAVACATVNAAKQTGIYSDCGSLDIGKRADILIVDEASLKIKQVIARGKTVYTAE